MALLRPSVIGDYNNLRIARTCVWPALIRPYNEVTTQASGSKRFVVIVVEFVVVIVVVVALYIGS